MSKLPLNLLGGYLLQKVPEQALKSHLFTSQEPKLQFPVRLCFAMTINKSQGQSVKFVGLDLRRPVFTHGQFYIGVSRVTSVANIKVIWEHEVREAKIERL